jgi:hypothetical protein
MNVFQVVSKARRLGEETTARLFIGKIEPHAGSSCLVIRGTGTAGVVVTAEPRLTISME